jgi:pimeloyl-ACP methyl ester carboxylesterase
MVIAAEGMMKRILFVLLVLAGVVAALLTAGYFVLKRPDISYETLAEAYESDDSRYADLPSGVRVHYRDQGQGPTLVLIHGFSASLHTWEPWVERLATGENRISDYRIISLDLPGHGLTRAPEDYEASIEAFRDVVAEFVASQDLQRFALAGSSMGGNVAWEYALAHPDQVEALILVDASGWPETRAEFTDDPPVFKLLRNPVLGPLVRDLDNTNLIRGGLEASFGDPALVDEAMVARYSDLSRAPGHREILLQMTLGFRSRNFATAERLAPLSMPVLVLAGDRDMVVPVDHARMFNEAIPGSQLVLFEGAGHIPQEEAADDSAMAVHEFLYQAHEGAAAAAE